MEVDTLDLADNTEGNDSINESINDSINEESVENEESVVDEEEEQQEVESQDTSGILQDLSRAYSTNKKITIKLPSPIDPQTPEISKTFREFWLLRPPPAGFAKVNGSHHKLHQEPAPLPRVVHNNLLTGLSSSQAQELRDLRQLLNNPFARHNMPTRPFIRNPASGDQQPQQDSHQGNPPKDKYTKGNSTFNFGESKPIYSIYRSP